MAVRRDPPQDVQWRAGHTTPAMTERYIANARYEGARPSVNRYRRCRLDC